MSLRKTPIAAALALCGAMPLVAQAAPTVSWSAPTNGATLSGTLSGSACGATTSSDAIQVTFWANDWQLNNDYSPPWNCNFPTTQLRDGTYTLRAVAYDAKGGISESRINVTVAPFRDRRHAPDDGRDIADGSRSGQRPRGLRP